MISGVSLSDLFSASLPASWRGIEFYVLDTKLTAGRRLQKILFPGIDQPSFQDLGVLDGPIVVTGFIAGDLYVRGAEGLRTAFRTGGVGALVLPWLSTAVQVVLAQPAEISFSIKELRIARFSAQFEISSPYQAAPLDTLEQLETAIANLKAQVTAWIGGVLAPLQVPLALIGYAQHFAGYVAGAFSVAGALVGSGSDSSIVAAAVAPPLATLAATAISASEAGWAADMAAALVDVPQQAADASVPVLPAAVGPGGPTTMPTPADPQATATMLLAAAAQIVAEAVYDPAPGPALSAALVALCVASAADASSDILFASAQDAAAWRTVLISAIDGATAAVGVECAASPLLAGGAWRALIDLRSAVMIDMQAEIGRLPSVQILTLPRTMSAWLVAEYLAGDTPGNVLTAYADLVARNAVMHPALVPGGPVEYLA